MKVITHISAALTVTLVLVASHANADDGKNKKTIFNVLDDVVGGGVCDSLNSTKPIVGCGTSSGQQADKPSKRNQIAGSNSNRQPDALRQRNRDIQRALNHFGFDAGAVDGQLGRKSRAAMSKYQSYMGETANGQLTQTQRQDLIDAYKRDTAGEGKEYADIVQEEGNKGLLKAFSDPDYADEFREAKLPAEKSGSVPPVGNSQDEKFAGLPDINDKESVFPDLNASEADRFESMAIYCELVDGLTDANGGVMTINKIDDPNQALGEQFCDARTYAITQSESLLERASISEAQLVKACIQIAGSLNEATSRIAKDNTRHVKATANRIVGQMFGNDTKKALRYGELCLGTGYRQDNAEIALGAATVLMAIGKIPYAEILGHHLRFGFGADRSEAASVDWYETALAAMDQGEAPVFFPTKSAQRNAIIAEALKTARIKQTSNSLDGTKFPDLTLIKD
ncbi:MAG: peptidoglycan-binding protein [Roseobacter sp.]